MSENNSVESSSHSNHKRIIINPDLFSVSSKTRKNKKSEKGIRMKGDAVDANNKTTRAKIIKTIREQQKRNYDKMITDYNRKMHGGDNANTHKDTSQTAIFATSPDKNSTDEFKESLEFLKSAVRDNDITEKKQEQLLELNNKTPSGISEEGEYRLKHYHKMNEEAKHRAHNESLKISSINISSGGNNKENLEEIFPLSSTIDTTQNIMHLNRNTNILPAPNYGVLKNGNLPTYRSYFNQTQKATPSVSMHDAQRTLNEFAIGGIVSAPNSNSSETARSISGGSPSQYHSIKQRFMQKHIQPRLKSYHQKKIVRRTFKVGKSKYAPKIGVLVSNKTIRRDIEIKHQLLKQISMEDIRKYLVKRGLIKIGSGAPENVLRRLYESAIMIGGDIQNHNKEIILYNYLNE